MTFFNVQLKIQILLWVAISFILFQQCYFLLLCLRLTEVILYQSSLMDMIGIRWEWKRWRVDESRWDIPLHCSVAVPQRAVSNRDRYKAIQTFITVLRWGQNLQTQSAEGVIDNPVPVPNAAECKDEKAAKLGSDAQMGWGGAAFAILAEKPEHKNLLPAWNSEGPGCHVLMPTYARCKSPSLASWWCPGAAPGAALAVRGRSDTEPARRSPWNTKHAGSISSPSKPVKNALQLAWFCMQFSCRIRGELGSRWSFLRCACLS